MLIYNLIFEHICTTALPQAYTFTALISAGAHKKPQSGTKVREPSSLSLPVAPCPYTTVHFREAMRPHSDQLATTLLQMHFTGVHPAGDTQAPARMEKFRRPTISPAGSHEEWSYFLTR